MIKYLSTTRTFPYFSYDVISMQNSVLMIFLGVIIVKICFLDSSSW